jgi:hypothetical protein
MNRTNEYGFLNKLNLSDTVISSLSRHLDRTVSGDETILTSPISKSHDPNFLLTEWDKVFKTSSKVMSSNLTSLESQQRSKFGPRSIAMPWSERRDSVLAYFSDECAIDSGLQEKLFDFSSLGPTRLRPLSYDSALKFLKNDTNSGLPFFTRKGLVKDDYSSDLQENNSLMTRNDPCIMFTRTQEQKKTRAVWGYPMADTLDEMRYYRPLFDHQKNLSWRSALRGPDETNRNITKIVTQAIESNEKLVSIDFSLYDTTVKSSLQKASFKYIKSLFQSQFHPDIDEIALRFKDIGLVTPDGILKGDHGVPSGSTFTNEVDSIAQYLCASLVNINSDCFDIQGDDGAYRTSDPELLKSSFRSFGLNVNDDKSYVLDGALVYLQNLYDIEHIEDGIIGGIYPTYRALNRIIYLERFDNFTEDEIIGSDYFAIRTLAILENCKHHPLFEEFVKFILRFDKYKLKFSENGLLKYIKRISKSSGSEGIIMNQYSDDLSGIKSFASFKIVEKLNHG